MKIATLIAFLFLAIGTLSAKDLYKNVNIDIYGGAGKRTLHGVDFENIMGKPDLYGSLRLGYKLSKSLQVETGYTNTRYGAFENWMIDSERYMGSWYMAGYHNFPMLVRVRPYKKYWIGAGAQYSLLRWVKFYERYRDKEFTYVKDGFNPGVWSMYFDIKWLDENFGYGINYSRSYTPLRYDNDAWKMSYFNIYLLLDLNLVIKRKFFSYTNKP